MVFLTWKQAIDLAEILPERYRALIYLAVDSGMRWGELIGLRRARLDLGLRKVRVTEQLIKSGAGEWIWVETKTAGSVRSITISPFTASILAEHLEHFAQPGLDGLVFVNQANHPLISSSFLTHHFKPARESLGLSCRFHDLRLTSVAWPSVREHIRKQYKLAWGTPRSMSLLIAMVTSFPNLTRHELQEMLTTVAMAP